MLQYFIINMYLLSEILVKKFAVCASMRQIHSDFSELYFMFLIFPKSFKTAKNTDISINFKEGMD